MKGDGDGRTPSPGIPAQTRQPMGRGCHRVKSCQPESPHPHPESPALGPHLAPCRPREPAPRTSWSPYTFKAPTRPFPPSSEVPQPLCLRRPRVLRKLPHALCPGEHRAEAAVTCSTTGPGGPAMPLAHGTYDASPKLED